MIKGKIAEIIDAETAVINVGSVQGVKVNMKFLSYIEGREIKDPDSGESLGRLEISKGEFVVISVQDRMSRVKSVVKVIGKEFKPGAGITNLGQTLAALTATSTYLAGHYEEIKERPLLDFSGKAKSDTAFSSKDKITVGDLVREIV